MSIFKKEELTTFTGIVDEGCVSKIGTDSAVSLGFSFFAYAKNDSEIIEEEIYVTKEIPSFEYDVSNINQLDIITIKGVQIEHYGQQRILLSSIEQVNVKDKRFELIRNKRKQPITFDSEKLGVFTLERGPNWFVSTQIWYDHEIELMLMDEDTPPISSEKAAISLFEKQRYWHRKFVKIIIEELLPLKNESWLEEHDQPFTESDFEKRIKITSISVWDDGAFESWFDDGDLFWGHGINVNGNLSDGVESAGIAG
ncbi:DUF2262 domain-containing protein [Catalinimonas niigatensis]|uniref:DUF2262 domain-containing protein n=1 Tax=Catalinimonas niigatensis TaxID=1397264 RepID=UPI0026666BE3|nr:DUF2262 domain-containing protein [Catalinimonas niigatensis]WPP52997.1 DUF2262 domain-containing protein [Catalinimonas niigatensis]